MFVCLQRRYGVKSDGTVAMIGMVTTVKGRRRHRRRHHTPNHTVRQALPAASSTVPSPPPTSSIQHTYNVLPHTTYNNNHNISNNNNNRCMRATILPAVTSSTITTVTRIGTITTKTPTTNPLSELPITPQNSHKLLPREGEQEAVSSSSNYYFHLASVKLAITNCSFHWMMSLMLRRF